MRKLTKNEQGIVEYLTVLYHSVRAGDWVSPTNIGQKVGGRMLDSIELRGASWASPICLRLVRFGVLQRNYEGHYRVRPRWIMRKR